MIGKIFSTITSRMAGVRNVIEPPDQKVTFFLERTYNIRRAFEAEQKSLDAAIGKLRTEVARNQDSASKLIDDIDYTKDDDAMRRAKLELAYYQQLRADVAGRRTKAL